MFEPGDPITDVKALTAEELTRRLRRNGFLEDGEVDAVEVGETFDSSCAFWTRLDVRYSEDAEGVLPTDLLLKTYRKGWFGGGWAEWVYVSELAANTPGAAVVPTYDFGLDPEAKACHFIQADMSRTHDVEPPKRIPDRPYKRVVEEAAKYHARWWGDARLNAPPFMGRHGGPLRMAQAIGEADIRGSAAQMAEEIPKFVEKQEEEVPAAWLDLVERALAAWPELLLERTAGGKDVTLIHGDLHLWNVLYPKNPDRDNLILIDWETYKRGLGAYDLAYLLVQGTSDRKKLEEPLREHYYKTITKAGIGYDREQFEWDFRLSVIACLFPPLVWGRLWSLKSAVDAVGDWGCEELL